MTKDEILLAGELSHRVKLQRPVHTLNSAGETVEGWDDVREVWASVRPVRAYEQERAKQVERPVSHVVRLRYAADVAGDWRIRFGGLVLNVVGVVDIGMRRVTLELACQQVSE
jgi:SPP1 family predicted phage head-tail adaptor